MAEYIDRGTFKKSVEERYCKPCKAEGKDHNGCWCRACWVDDMLDEVDRFQPADVAPVVHGRDVYKWHKEGHCEFKCSVCGAWAGIIEGGTFDGVDFDYCPNCGAKMDGGDNNAAD